jgi:hypothetical protein
MPQALHLEPSEFSSSAAKYAASGSPVRRRPDRQGLTLHRSHFGREREVYLAFALASHARKAGQYTSTAVASTVDLLLSLLCVYVLSDHGRSCTVGVSLNF